MKISILSYKLLRNPKAHIFIHSSIYACSYPFLDVHYILHLFAVAPNRIVQLVYKIKSVRSAYSANWFYLILPEGKKKFKVEVARRSSHCLFWPTDKKEVLSTTFSNLQN